MPNPRLVRLTDTGRRVTTLGSPDNAAKPVITWSQSVARRSIFGTGRYDAGAVWNNNDIWRN
jgi:hypothetical protein